MTIRWSFWIAAALFVSTTAHDALLVDAFVVTTKPWNFNSPTSTATMRTTGNVRSLKWQRPILSTALSADAVKESVADNQGTDITVYGATGVTGKYVLQYLRDAAEAYDRPLRVTLAGRNQAKLESQKAILLEERRKEQTDKARGNQGTSAADEAAVEFDIFVASSEDLSRLKVMAERTKVVISCAGPFEKYSSGVVEACANEGTDYVDISAEHVWVAEMRTKHGPAAAASGARLVSFCGFDSVPSDLAAFGAVQALREASNEHDTVDIKKVISLVFAVGGLNGGTMETVSRIPLDIGKMFFKPDGRLRNVPFFGEDPLIGATCEPESAETESIRDTMARAEWKNQLLWLDPSRGYTVTAPFFMAPLNSKTVQRSAFELGYGKNFEYYERFISVPEDMLEQAGILTAIPATLVQLMFGLGFSLTRLPVVGEEIVKTLFPPGSAAPDIFNKQCLTQVHASAYPSDESSSNGMYGLCNLDFEGDPGNLATSQCVAESALCLLWNRDELPPKTHDGFGTPAQQLGAALLHRLEHTTIRPIKVKRSVAQDGDR